MRTQHGEAKILSKWYFRYDFSKLQD